MFSFFKSNDKSLQPITFDSIGCDMHSHFIAGIDDGSPNLKTSVELVRKMHTLGFKKVITTPHIMPDYYRNTPEIIQNGLKELKLELERQDIDIEVLAAAEYFIDYCFEEKIESGEKFLTIGNNHILIETSFISIPPNFEQIIFKLQLAGYRIILAHPERFGFLSFEDLKSYKTRSIELQINLLSLLGFYGKSVRKMAEKLIDNGMVDYVGTDCHNLQQADLYTNCFTNRYWHKLVQSGNLKNHLL